MPWRVVMVLGCGAGEVAPVKKTSSSRFASTSRIEDSSSAGSISAFKELVEVTAEDLATHAGEGLKDARHLAGRKIQPSFAIVILKSLP